MDRRKFIGTSCRVCLMAFASTVVLNEIACSASSVFVTNSKDGVIKIPLSKFQSGNYLLVKANSIAEKIMIVKRSEDDFEALLMKCTHKGVELVHKDNMLVCDAHGSIFDQTGKVLNGPAKLPLFTYKTFKKGKELIVQL